MGEGQGNGKETSVGGFNLISTVAGGPQVEQIQHAREIKIRLIHWG